MYLYWLESAAHLISALAACSIVAVLLASAPGASLNRWFSLYAFLQAAWSLYSLAYATALRTGADTPEALLHTAALLYVLRTPVLLIVAAEYLSTIGRPVARFFLRRAAYVGAAVVLVAAVPLYLGLLISDPELSRLGLIRYRVTPFGFAVSLVPVVFIAWSLALVRPKSQTRGEPFLAYSAIVLLLGFLLDGLFSVDFPLLSTTSAASIVIIGYAVLSRNLFHPLRELNSRLDVVNRISRAAGQGLGLETLLETVYREITPIFRADSFYIALYDSDRRMLDFPIQVDEGRRFPAITGSVESGYSSLIIRERKPLLVPDPDAEDADPPEPVLWGTGRRPTSWMGAPMIVGEGIIGIISVQSYGSRRYDREDLKLLSTIAGETGVAVENVRLIDDLRRELEERNRAEVVLRESEEKFRNLAEHSPNMIFINLNGRIVYANRRCEEVIGYRREELCDPQFSFIDLIATEDRDRIVGFFRMHLSGKNVSPYEYGIVTRDGQRIDAINSSRVISYEGRPAILGVVTDITSQRRYGRFMTALNEIALDLEAARNTDELYPTIGRHLSGLRIGCALHLESDAERDVFELTYVASLFDRTSILASLAPDHRISRGELGLEVEPIHLPAESRFVPIAGDRPIPLPVIVCPIIVEGHLAGSFTVESAELTGDDAPIIQAFASLIAAAWNKTRLIEDLDGRVRELRTTQQRLVLSRKLEAIGTLSGGIAHDFNNLLAAISGYADIMLLEPDIAEPIHQYLAEIKATVRRANGLVSQLLAFGRRRLSDPSFIDLNELVRGMKRMMTSLVSSEVELEFDLEPDLPPIWADATQIEQLVLNVVVNARDAMPVAGRLTVSTRIVSRGSLPQPLHSEASSPRYAGLGFTDTGHGIDHEIIDQIFDPFFTTKPDGKGTGLGLATVHGIATQHGGLVEVQSEPGHGTTFTVYLPFDRAGEPPAKEGRNREW